MAGAAEIVYKQTGGGFELKQFIYFVPPVRIFFLPNTLMCARPEGTSFSSHPGRPVGRAATQIIRHIFGRQRPYGGFDTIRFD